MKTEMCSAAAFGSRKTLNFDIFSTMQGDNEGGYICTYTKYLFKLP